MSQHWSPSMSKNILYKILSELYKFFNKIFLSWNKSSNHLDYHFIWPRYHKQNMIVSLFYIVISKELLVIFFVFLFCFYFLFFFFLNTVQSNINTFKKYLLESEMNPYKYYHAGL